MLLCQQTSVWADTRTINLTAAGTLSKYIPTTDYDYVSNLKLSGPINGDDIKLLNKLPKLETLDLAGTWISSGGDYYYTSYNSLLKTTDYYYTAETNSYKGDVSRKTNKYYRNDLAHAFGSNKTIRTITLPDNSKFTKIGSQALSGTNLEVVNFSGYIDTLDYYSFFLSYSLKTIRPTKNTHFEVTDGYLYQQLPVKANGSVTALKKKTLAFVPPGYNDLVIRDYVDSISAGALSRNFSAMYFETDDVKNFVSSFDKSGTNRNNVVYAYPSVAEKLKNYFNKVNVYGVAPRLVENVFNRMTFTLDTVISTYATKKLKVLSVTCNGKPCTLNSAGNYVADLIGIKTRNVVVEYALGDSTYTAVAEYPKITPIGGITVNSVTVGQTFFKATVSAKSYENLKPTKEGIVVTINNKISGSVEAVNHIAEYDEIVPGSYIQISPYAYYDGECYFGESKTVTLATLAVSMSNLSSTPTSISCSGAWTKGDAKISDYGFTVNGTRVATNTTSLHQSNLKPNTAYSVTFFIECNGKRLYTSKSITTKSLTLTTLPAEAVSDNVARICATTNCDASTGTGFEWRRYDAPDLVPSTYSPCPLINGKMSGTLQNLRADTYYKYRPYYKAEDGTYYYGEWSAFGTSDRYVYFEPDVYTSSYAIADDAVVLRGCVVMGSDKILKQGFEYWPAAKSASPSLSGTMPQAVQTVLTTGDNMEATLTDLSPNTTYYYRAFATTNNGTTYGATSQFTSPDAIGISNVSADNAPLTIQLRNSASPMFTAKGANASWTYSVTMLSGQTLLHDTAAQGQWISLGAINQGVVIVTVSDGLYKVSQKIRLR